MLSTEQIKAEASAYGDEIISFRRHLHMHPETGFDTEETEKFIKTFLAKENIEVLKSTVGVIGKISAGRNKRPGCVALRADMDALPLTEANNTSYKSQTPGKMHACGHDGHTSMLMGAAHILNSHRDELLHDIILIFQPAEEGPKLGGARIMIKDLDKLDITNNIISISALHVTTEYPCGQILIGYGPMMASTDEFDIEITGVGGHCSAPHKAVDAMSLAAKFVIEMESFIAKRIDPLDSVVCGIGTLNAGTARNIIPQTATMTGSLRCQREESRQFVLDGIDKLLKALCEYSGATYKLATRHGLPVLVTNDDKTAQVEVFAQEIAGFDKTIRLKHSNMGSEDFAYLAERIPATFSWLGVRNEAKGFTHMMHNPKFDMDESALPIGCALLCKIAITIK